MRLPFPLKSLPGIGMLVLLCATSASTATSTLAVTSASTAEGWQAARLLAFVEASCRAAQSSPGPAPGFATGAVVESQIRFREQLVGTRYRLPVDNAGQVELEVIERGGKPARFISSLYNEFGDPLVLISLDSVCEQQVARQISYTEKGQAIHVISLDRNLEPAGEPDWLNPPLEFVSRSVAPALKHPGDATPLRVGMVDSGVNYRLPEINRRLARDADDQLIGFDFWDMDVLPYDAHPINSGFFLQRHGTRTASLLLREAPAIELVPYRYPRPDMSRMQALVEHAARHEVDIIGMPLGSNRAEDWGSFERAARAHPQMLFIVSAGNDGRDIDTQPVYPASLGLDNLLVVTSADDFVRPAERTNWGKISVDYMVPAERLAALDYSGAETRVSGSSYAVARVTALAARLKQAHRHWQAADLVQELRRRYSFNGGGVLDWVSTGYIADPLAGAPIARRPLPAPAPALKLPAGEPGFALSLEILVLDERWSGARIEQALQQAYEILGQCGIVAGEISIDALDTENYLRDLSTGNAYTLLAAAHGKSATVVFARDTRMQAEYLGEAFGIGNTRMRPWLTNSVWLMLDVDDPGIALGHELYHVIANSGAHVEGVPNLMQPDTRPESLELTTAQCQLAQAVGVANRLLSKPD